jgi:hypothetical protein
MDVLFYGKDLRDDLKADRIGRLRSNKDKLESLKEGCPNYIWILKTPAGQKGRFQLLARLLWSDKSLVKFPKEAGDSHIFYDPDHPKSVWFDGGDEERTIEATTVWARTHFPTAVRANFQGPNGQQELRGVVLHELVGIAKPLVERPFRTATA